MRGASLIQRPGGVKPRPRRRGAGTTAAARGRFAACAALAAGALLAAAPPAFAAEARSEARRLQAGLRTVRALVGRFTQVVESPGLPSPRVERGTVHLARPGRMRWDYDDPPGKLAVTDGTRAWLYLPEDRQVIVSPLRRGDSGIGVLLDESSDILREFTVAWEPADPPAPRRLRLTPRRPGAPFDHLLVEPGPEAFPVSVAVVDPLGGAVTWRFSLVRLLDTADPSLFRFTPPAGVEVQESGP
jgi:outer membrane lipoprotein-sorting protein